MLWYAFGVLSKLYGPVLGVHYTLTNVRRKRIHTDTLFGYVAETDRHIAETTPVPGHVHA